MRFFPMNLILIKVYNSCPKIKNNFKINLKIGKIIFKTHINNFMN